MSKLPFPKLYAVLRSARENLTKLCSFVSSETIDPSDRHKVYIELQLMVDTETRQVVYVPTIVRRPDGSVLCDYRERMREYSQQYQPLTVAMDIDSGEIENDIKIFSIRAKKEDSNA